MVVLTAESKLCITKRKVLWSWNFLPVHTCTLDHNNEIRKMYDCVDICSHAYFRSEQSKRNHVGKTFYLAQLFRAIIWSVKSTMYAFIKMHWLYIIQMNLHNHTWYCWSTGFTSKKQNINIWKSFNPRNLHLVRDAWRTATVSFPGVYFFHGEVQSFNSICRCILKNKHVHRCNIFFLCTSRARWHN